MTTAVEHVQQMQDHWWWRPGWRAGRHYYACHFAMSRYDEITQLATTYRSAIREFPGLDTIPDRWLHLTMQGVGFLDEVSTEERSELTSALRAALTELPPPTVTFHRPVVRQEAVYLPAEPAGPINEVRAVVRSVITQILGAPRLDPGPGEYRPHVSLAYSNRAQDASPIAAALASVEASRVTVRLDQVELLEFHRDNQMYEWTSSEVLPLGG
jgi:2'-5' RNA ligase